MKAAEKTLDLPLFFSTTPLVLRHSPLDPTCPARIAQAVEKAKKATDLRQNPRTAAPVEPPQTEVTVLTTPAIGAANPFAPLVTER